MQILIKKLFTFRTGLPLTSSPAPLRRGRDKFDFDDSITSPHAIKKALFAKKSASLLMMQEKSSNDHDENKENLMNNLETTVEIKEKVIIYIYILKFRQIFSLP